jgi:hypothetical protein
MSEVVAARTIEARIEGLYWAPGSDFVSTPRDPLPLTYGGIPGDNHFGRLRKSGAREPWYPRGTEMINERQLSILSSHELDEVAGALGLSQLAPEWIGGNIVLSGIPNLSHLPPRTLLMFESGATVRIDGDNGPCRHAGRAIVRHVPDRPDLEFGFVKAAKYKRGLVGWVEREGELRVGEIVRVRIWEQRIYSE